MQDNPPVGVRIRVGKSERLRPPSVTLGRANQPGCFVWSTTERATTLELVNWALKCWSWLSESHCVRVEGVE